MPHHKCFTHDTYWLILNPYYVWSWQLMICCGVSLTYLIGAYLNWRILALIGNVLSGVLFTKMKLKRLCCNSHLVCLYFRHCSVSCTASESILHSWVSKVAGELFIVWANGVGHTVHIRNWNFSSFLSNNWSQNMSFRQTHHK